MSLSKHDATWKHYEAWGIILLEETTNLTQRIKTDQDNIL